jgi:hypothetical protein
MKILDRNRNPSDRQLRQFGLASLVALPLLAWLWTRGNLTATLGMAAAGAVLAGLGAIRPRGLRPVFLGLSLVAMPIGLAINELAMLLLFCGVFLPIGLIFRVIGRDGLTRKFDAEASSYWQPKRQPKDAASYFRRW